MFEGSAYHFRLPAHHVTETGDHDPETAVITMPERVITMAVIGDHDDRIPQSGTSDSGHYVKSGLYTGYPPTPEEQLGRTEFSRHDRYLHRTGRAAAAERHFVRAGELAPHDFTMRRGSMPIRGMDPMGPDFAELYTEWVQAGQPYYRRIPTKDA